jgi:hypothetical protein
MGRDAELSTLVNSLRYLAVFERKTSLLYEDVAEKLEVPLAKALLQNISLDSRKHAISLKSIVQSMPKNGFRFDMPREMREAWSSIDTFQIELSKVDTIDQNDMSNLVEQFARWEDSLAAEYYGLLQFNTIDLLHKQMNKPYKVDFETLKTVLQQAQRDEEYHREILVMVTGLLKREETVEIDNTPRVTFRNPDGWSRPTTPMIP